MDLKGILAITVLQNASALSDSVNYVGKKDPIDLYWSKKRTGTARKKVDPFPSNLDLFFFFLDNNDLKGQK